MSDIEFFGSKMDHLLRSPTGPVGQYLQAKGEDVRRACDDEAGIVIKRSGTGIMGPPELRTGPDGELEVSVATDSSHRTSRNLASKANREGGNSWLGRGLFRAI